MLYFIKNYSDKDGDLFIMVPVNEKCVQLVFMKIEGHC